MKKDCPKINSPPTTTTMDSASASHTPATMAPPQVSNIVSRKLEAMREGLIEGDSVQLIKCYGHIVGERVVVLFDPGSTKNAISDHQDV